MDEQDVLENEAARLAGQMLALTQRMGSIKLALEETTAQLCEVVMDLKKLRARETAREKEVTT